MPITVAVDANGADLGPAEVAAGAADAAQQGIPVVLFGPAEQFGEVADGIEVVDAPVSIAKAPDPVRASRSNPDASIVLATRAVAAGDADAFVSGGSTGPAMGAALAQVVLGIERPRVGLLSIGEEASKGTPLVVEAHAALRDRLAEGDTFDFVGNVEGDDVPAGKADVVVTDGFTGNVALKLMEGTARSVVTAVRDAARSGPLAAFGGLLLRPKLAGLRARLDPEVVGGAYLL